MSTSRPTITEPRRRKENSHDTAVTASESSREVTVIEPLKGWVHLDFAELWHYRHLLVQFVQRDFTARYRQSVLGVSWAIINPIVQMVVFTLVFGKMAKLPSDGVPYPIFNFAGLLPWLYFSNCLKDSSGAAVAGGSILTKVYFPRLIFPLSKVVVGLIDFGIQLVLLVLMMLWYGVYPASGIVFLPFFILLAAISALSVGLWTAALHVKYRDVGQMIAFISVMWMWITPVVYSITLVPAKWRAIYSMNPMVGVIEGFRWAMLNKAAPDWTLMAISTTMVIALFVGGLYFFRRTEATFADVI